MQVQLTQAQVSALRQRAARQRVSVSAVVRQAVDDWTIRTETPMNQAARARAIAAAGRFASGRTDVAERHDDYLVEAFGVESFG
ncbi:MAG TPA: ribbon-helix-helix protein, CopG family [Lamprocystis sp. (in: g-proteobacteria)]|nr:ribbon-helix-helix protein, CopG family [Lamprocystis sp. (in: g-proteobacteria)]